MKTNYILIGLVSVLVSLSGQTYKNVRAKQGGLSITVQYDMAGKLFRGDQVALTYSLDNGKAILFSSYIFVGLSAQRNKA